MAALIPLVVVRVRPASPVALPTHMRTVTENREVEQALQEHLTAKTSEAFGDSSGLLLASAHNELEPGS